MKGKIISIYIIGIFLLSGFSLTAVGIDASLRSKSKGLVLADDPGYYSGIIQGYVKGQPNEGSDILLKGITVTITHLYPRSDSEVTVKTTSTDQNGFFSMEIECLVKGEERYHLETVNFEQDDIKFAKTYEFIDVTKEEADNDLKEIIVYMPQGENNNNNPNAPSINAPRFATQSPVGKERHYYYLTYNAVDPDGDQVEFLVYQESGDYSSIFYRWFGPFDSGEEYEDDLTWNHCGKRQLRIRARDSNGAISNWAEEEIIVLPPFLESLVEFLNIIFS